MQDFADAVHSQDPLTLAGLNTGATLSGAPQIAINGFDSIGVTPTSGRNDITGQIADTLSWTVGKHQLRFGLEYRRAYIDLYYNWGARGAFNFGTGPSVLGPWAGDTSVTDPNVLTLADFLAGYSYTSGITLGTQERFIYTHTGSAFAEDSWQVTPKLNVNLGLRYDYQQPYYTNDPNLSIFDPTSSTGLVVAGGGSGTPDYIYNSNKVDLSPRVGLSYQALNGTVVRANYGIYYDQPAGQAFFGNIGIPNGGAGGVNNNPAGSQPNESIVLNTPSRGAHLDIQPGNADLHARPGSAHGQQRGLHLLGQPQLQNALRRALRSEHRAEPGQGVAVERRLRGHGQPPQPRPAGHQPECTGRRPEPLDGCRPERLHVQLPAVHAALLLQVPQLRHHQPDQLRRCVQLQRAAGYAAQQFVAWAYQPVRLRLEPQSGRLQRL